MLARFLMNVVFDTLNSTMAERNKKSPNHSLIAWTELCGYVAADEREACYKCRHVSVRLHSKGKDQFDKNYYCNLALAVVARMGICEAYEAKENEQTTILSQD